MDRLSRTYSDTIREAHAQRQYLRIQGEGTRQFLSAHLEGEILDTRPYRGIVAYEPEELFVTVRAGTPLVELEEVLCRQGQYLRFEPPRWDNGGSVGGMVAAGFSGPRRMASGPLRDYLLGVSILDGQGRNLRFGGTVIKNVAGYDVTRLFSGSWGRLGLLLDVTLKVLPKPSCRMTLSMNISQSEALHWLNRAYSRPWPLDASLFLGSLSGRLWIRLEGGHAAVREAFSEIRRELPLEEVDPVQANAHWHSVQTPTHSGMNTPNGTHSTLWRISIPPTAPPLKLQGDIRIEWHGGLRWWWGNIETQTMDDLLREHRGWGIPFDERYISANLWNSATASATVRNRIQRHVIKVFDPAGIFSPRRA